MIIIGADLATQSGLCYGRPDQTPQCATVRAPVTGKDYGGFGAFYYRVFTNLIGGLATQLLPDEPLLVNYETPILPAQTSLATTRKLQSLGVLLETVCTLSEHRAQIECRECNVKTIKKELGGHGGANKADMVFVARRAGLKLPDGDEAMDAADAFGAWVLAVRHHAPAWSPAWDKRLYGGRWLGS